MADNTQVKVCLNCGDLLLEQAKKCPTCGKKDLLLIDRSEKEKINEIVNSVPNPKEGQTAKWKTSNNVKGKKEVIAERKKKASDEGIACCPKCGSTSLTAQKKGFGLLKGAAGVLVAGPYGAVAAGIGKNKVLVTCLNCGHQFKPGK